MLRYFIYGAIFAIALYIYPAEAAFKCAPLGKEIESLFKKKYAILATAEIGDNGTAVMIMIEPYGNFIVLGVDKKLNACQLMQGHGWTFIIPKAA